MPRSRYAYQGYGRNKPRSRKSVGTRSRVQDAAAVGGGGEGENAPTGDAGPMSATGLAVATAIAKGLLGPGLGDLAAYGMTKANQRAHQRAHNDTIGDPGQYGAGSGDSPGAVAGHDSSDNDSHGQGGSDPGNDI